MIGGGGKTGADGVSDGRGGDEFTRRGGRKGGDATGGSGVIRLEEEFFLPGELILEQGNTVDQLYFVCHGVLIEERGSGLAPADRLWPLESVAATRGRSYDLRPSDTPRQPREDPADRSRSSASTRADMKISRQAREGRNGKIRVEGVGIDEDGTEESISQFDRNCSFGEIAILCNIPQPFTVRVCELCRLLRLDKRSFTNILEIYFVDARVVLSNLLEGGEYNSTIKQLESDIILHIGRQETELSLKVNSAASHGDLNYLKSLIRAGADPKKTDYDGRSPLHIAASKGYRDIALFLIQEDVDINAPDKYGNTPLLEAIKCKHDLMASILFDKGAKLGLSEPGIQLCSAVSRGDTSFLKRVLSYGADPNSKDYDHRTPLHIAACEGLYLIAELLLEAGASVFSLDR
ncbi:Potassium channel KOR1 [Platanthera guangdongensis]|uniref:Potassium channel n=1 Tax=Platanthera guangdongensis TaxID=2320717 RepID=A0ABR2M8U8_9ASPA